MALYQSTKAKKNSLINNHVINLKTISSFVCLGLLFLFAMVFKLYYSNASLNVFGYFCTTNC